MQTSPFQATGNTQSLNVTATASTAFQLTTGGGGSGSQVRIANVGPNAAFVTWAAPAPAGSGSSSTVAVIPTSGNPPGTSQFGVWMLSSTIETFTIPQGSWISAICAAAQTATLHFAIGEGV